jgi:predicted acylesterase/phospholipase RssA
MSETRSRAQSFLAGETLTFDESNALWKQCRKEDELSIARSVLSRMRREACSLIGGLPPARMIKEELCRQEALLTSKDPELNTSMRHDRALEVLAEEFDINDPRLDGDAETLGIAGGIYKRKWDELGKLDDLKRSADLYERGAKGALGDDAYAHINAAFVDDLLAEAGDDPTARRERAASLRKQIIIDLPISGTWWNAATRAEAFFGLRKYREARDALTMCAGRPEPWCLQTSARQLATLARLHEPRPFDITEIRAVFDALLPGAADAVRSVFVGKLGLALSGGGFRASFYHLGVLARLAELDVLRHLDVLSCVSGGSIIGACYWLALRRRMLDSRPVEQRDYIDLVRDLIIQFESAVATDVRGQVQPSKMKAVWGALCGHKGVIDPELTADALEKHFYRPLFEGNEFESLNMDQLAFKPADHNENLTACREFNPSKHNWMRAHKVPVLVINATSVNTGHAWQFTPTWMGESPWSVHEAADSVPRLEWSWYEPAAGWRIRLARAVAASASVPGLFEPLRIDDAYEGLQVLLVDGGVHDNQGSVSLLALNCNVLIISDASGQLLLEREPKEGLKELPSYAKRSMDTLMERIRLANFADLSARRQTGSLRGLLFLHMKAGLDADPIRLRFSQAPYGIRRTPLSPSGIRKDFQKVIAELRTDLNVFTQTESRALMACGYQMTKKGFPQDLANITELWADPTEQTWPFTDMLTEITSTAAATPAREGLLTALREGSKVQI